eukprot:6561207-Prymnesium_polylepis.1
MVVEEVVAIVVGRVIARALRAYYMVWRYALLVSVLRYALHLWRHSSKGTFLQPGPMSAGLDDDLGARLVHVYSSDEAGSEADFGF